MPRYTVHAKPGSRRPGVEAGDDGTLTVRVAARAVDGAANEAVVAAVAEHFGVARSAVSIVRGRTARRKLVDVALPD
ncbi:MAG: DUF167 domain-containing protein [Microbacterium sp.]|nr:DUF167 domain-containing protein [Microbacterium sp.]